MFIITVTVIVTRVNEHLLHCKNNMLYLINKIVATDYTMPG